jgi:protein TonB
LLDSSAALAQRLRTPAGQRLVAIGLALLLEALLLLLLFSLGIGTTPAGDTDLTVVNLEAQDYSGDAPQPSDEPEPEPEAAADPSPSEAQATPADPPPRPAERAVPPSVSLPVPVARPTLPPPPVDRSGDVFPRPIQPLPPGRAVQGPPNRPGSSGADTARVGTAPNGEPLYAAAWYREPADDELRGYLSTASGPGWGLIACRTAPDYRVEDCVAIAEYPQGSQINRAVLAAAWQFKVRPPRLGGRPQVGSWVQIRIDYGIERQ